MIDEPQITTATAQDTAVIRLTIPRAEIQQCRTELNRPLRA